MGELMIYAKVEEFGKRLVLDPWTDHSDKLLVSLKSQAMMGLQTSLTLHKGKRSIIMRGTKRDCYLV